MKLNPREQMLQDFIAAAKDAPVVWGESDCSSWPAAWVLRLTGRRVAIRAYASRDEAHALIAAAGGLDRLWDGALDPLGIHRTDAPELGDVAVCETRKYGQVGLIMAHGGIGYWRADAGVHALSPRGLVAAWRVA